MPAFKARSSSNRFFSPSRNHKRGGKPSVCFLFASVISRSRFISTNVSKYSRGPCESVILRLNLPKRFKIHSVKPSQSLDGRWWWRCWRLKVLVLVFWFRSSPALFLSSSPPPVRLCSPDACWEKSREMMRKLENYCCLIQKRTYLLNSNCARLKLFSTEADKNRKDVIYLFIS